MRAKQFFYACAGILIALFCYDLGAIDEASAQGATLLFVEETSPSEGCQFAIDTLGRVYQRGAYTLVWQVVAQLPAGTPASLAGVSIENSIASHRRFLIGMTNGDVWMFENADCDLSDVQFVSLGNIFSGTVQVEGTSITEVKTKFREEE